jgi:hypothetical protein
MSTRRCLSASVSLVLVWLAVSASTAFAQSPNQPSYNQLISSGNDLLKEGKPKEAYAAAMAAAQADDKRFEAGRCSTRCTR